MKTSHKSLFAIFALGLVAACGGGSGVTSVPAPTPAPVTSPAAGAQPASTSTADLVAFAKAGGDTVVVRDDVLRISRDFEGGSVSVDTVAGSNAGLVAYTNADGVTDYRINGAARADIVVGAGGYDGPLQLTYRTSPNGALKRAEGEFNMSVDFKSGTVATGGIVGNSTDVIEFFGDATIANGAFKDNATIVRLRNGQGEFVRDYTGTTNAIFVNGANGRDAAIGTVKSTGLNLNGGFVVNEYLGD